MSAPTTVYVRLPPDLSELMREIAVREARSIPKQLEYILRRALADEIAAQTTRKRAV